MTEMCSALVYGSPCDQASAGLTTMACGHEHFGTCAVCADCRSAMLALMASGDFTCDLCFAVDGHACSLAEVLFEEAGHEVSSGA